MTLDTQARMVRWRCNRGMLELDLILIPFSENHFEKLDADKKAEFIELLTHEDPTLFAWLMGHEEVSEAMKPIVEIVNRTKRF